MEACGYLTNSLAGSQSWRTGYRGTQVSFSRFGDLHEVVLFAGFAGFTSLAGLAELIGIVLISDTLIM